MAEAKCCLYTGVNSDVKMIVVVKVNIVLWVVFGVSLLIVGCGYRPLLRQESEPIPLTIRKIENQTAYRNLSALLTSSLRGQLRSSGVRVADGDTRGAAKIDIRIFSVFASTRAIRVVQNNELPVNRKWQLDALVTLESPSRERLFGPEVVSVSVLAATPSHVTGELVLSEYVRFQLLDALAEKLFFVVKEYL